MSTPPRAKIGRPGAPAAVAVVLLTFALVVGVAGGASALEPAPTGPTTTGPTTTGPTTTGPTTTGPTTTGPTTTAPPTTNSPPEPSPRIVGGVASQPGNGPWVVALLDATKDPFQGQFCGGSLIAPSWVLTAAHCTKYPAPAVIDVLTGRQLLSGSGGQRIRVVRAIANPNYNAYTDDNDLALLQLSDPSTSPTLPFLVPGFESAYSPGTGATVYGWGNVSATTTAAYPDELRQVTVPVLADSTCSSNSVYGTEYHSLTMVCAGSYPFGGKDSCNGDSGGPLVVPFGYGVAQVGIVSWGVNDPCAQPNYPGVYTRVPTYANWIAQGSRYGPMDMDSFIQRQFLDYNGTFAGSNLDFWRYVLASGASPGSLITSLNASQSWDYTAGSVTRLYRAFFKRDPDTGGLGYWISALRHGRGLGDVASYFAASPEFQTTYGSLGNSSFVDLVYQNVLGRAPDDGGRAYWLDRLAHGLSRGGLMISFSDSPEFRSGTDATVSRLILWFGALQRVPTSAEQTVLAGLSLQQIADSIPNNIEYNRRF